MRSVPPEHEEGGLGVSPASPPALVALVIDIDERPQQVCNRLSCLYGLLASRMQVVISTT